MLKNNAQKVEQRLVKPDIVCIGPRKTGTSWLYFNLSRHRQIWAPPVKELRFLAEGYLIPRHSIRNVLFSSHPHYNDLRRGLKKQMRRAFASRRIDKLRWMLNYSLGRRSFNWYSGLFPMTQQLGIDVSPIYYSIPEKRIIELKNHHPETKIIILIRNPIERIWSGARMLLYAHQDRSVDEVPRSEFIRLFDRTYQEWSPYLQTIALWQKHFEHVFVGFYDTLNENPRLFFMNICSFLGIDKTAVTHSLHKRIHQGISAELPLDLRRYLYNQYAEEIQEMAESGMTTAQKWLEEHLQQAG